MVLVSSLASLADLAKEEPPVRTPARRSSSRSARPTSRPARAETSRAVVNAAVMAPALPPPPQRPRSHLLAGAALASPLGGYPHLFLLLTAVSLIGASYP